MKFIHGLGISDKVLLAVGSLPRYIYWEGLGAGPVLANLHPLPMSIPALLNFNLLTWKGKLAAAFGAMGLTDAPPSIDEENIRQFVVRNLGEEVFDRVIDPFVSGVYAGDPDALSMKSALKKIHRLEGLGEFGPGILSGMLARFKEVAEETKTSFVDPEWRTYKSGELGNFEGGMMTLVKVGSSQAISLLPPPFCRSNPPPPLFSMLFAPGRRVLPR